LYDRQQIRLTEVANNRWRELKVLCRVVAASSSVAAAAKADLWVDRAGRGGAKTEEKRIRRRQGFRRR